MCLQNSDGSIRIFVPSCTSPQAWNANPEPLFTIKALAMSGNTKPEGYEAAAYYTPAAQTDNAQLIVSQVGEEANWKLCTDANVDKVRQEQLKVIRVG